MKKADFIVNFVYCLIMVSYLFAIVIFELPAEALNLLYVFLLFVPFQALLKKFFVVKRKVSHNNIIMDDQSFLERPYRTNNPYIDILKRNCRLLFIPAKFGFLIGIVLMIIGQFYFNLLFAILALLLVLMSPICAKKYKSKYDELENLYKTEIEYMFQEYLPDLHYSPFEGISESEYKFADFNHFDLFESEDYIYGKMLNRTFVISEVTTYYKVEDKNNKVEYVQNFQGTCGIINVFPPIPSFIYLVTPGFGIDVNGFKITTDNYEFNNNYDIFTNNELLATRLLTPTYMQKITDFRKKFGVYLELKVHYDVVFFRFHTGNLFAPNIFNQKEEDKNFAIYYQMILRMKEIMEETVKVLDSFSSY